MFLKSKRVQWMVDTISDCLNLKQNLINDFLQQEKNSQALEEFLDASGPKKILVYYQVQDFFSEENDEIKEQNADPTLFITTGETEKLKEKAVFFTRFLPENRPKVRLDEANDNEILFGELAPNCLLQLNNALELTYQPMLERLEEAQWGNCDEESVEEFNNLTRKFAEEVHDAIKQMAPGQDIFQLDPEEMARHSGSANDQQKIAYFERKFSQWLNALNGLLNDDTDSKKEPAEAGPRFELDYWRQRMQKINSWCEQLKSKDFQMVKNHLFRYKQHDSLTGRGRGGDENISKLIVDYNRLDLLLTDKLNEAKDNVKYLTTLEKFIDPLYNGTPQQIIDTLPALMNAIKMIHTIARFYNTADKMTGLFMKITNQMISNCKKRILDGQKADFIWNRDPMSLIEVLGSCIRLNKEYKDCYKETKDKVADMPKGKTFDFSETQIFGRFDLFCRRVMKLIEIFNTIEQFQSLARHNLEGMEKLTKKFNEIIEDFKKKRHDLLNYQNNQFDRDYVQFNVEISHLDVELQNYIDNNFNRFRNIEYSLKLLRKFESTLKRDSLKHNLTSKYNAILHNYATELDNIQRVFTDQKTNPPIVRNMPPEAGKIIWARHLFQKITGPINMFPENVINSAEIKKYYGSYNTLGKQLTIYEMWYYQNWCNEIEKSKAALQATLIVRHEENHKLYVNFDLEIMQLIREAKSMDRVGIEIPESARIILLQEEKFKAYYNELLYVLKEYERIIGKVKPIMKYLLTPHIEDLELKLRPGMVTLTWTSMNIDSYLQHVHNGLKKLEQLIININDIIENRIENNLKNVSKVTLVLLPLDSKPLGLDNFVQMQEDYIKTKTDFLVSKNIEVERAVDDLLQTIMSYPLDPHVDPVVPEEAKRIKRYYFWYLYQALLTATQNSLNAMKYRICGRRQTGPSSQPQPQLKPFFECYLELDDKDKEVKLFPDLDQIQKAINRAATAVLRCSKDLYNWEQENTDSDKKASFYEMIAQDKEIVKVILLLTGSIQGTRNKVSEFKSSFNKFEWLWRDSITDSIKAFNKKVPSPSLGDYDDKLKEFTNVEDQIGVIPSSNLIGAMELKTQNLTLRLKQCAKDWKHNYAEDLHRRANQQLDSLTENTKSLDNRLKKKVDDIDGLQYVMETLESIRVEQAEIEMKLNPVQDMYAILDNYGGISYDKDESDQRSMLKNNWDSLIQQAEISQKKLQQEQSKHLKLLKKNIKGFIQEVYDFRKDYELNGPMVHGIVPKEAVERLKRFEDEYSVKQHFFSIYKKGEDLFGLQNIKYPELEKTESELKNLKKLYGLYTDVIDSIQQWREMIWCDVSNTQLNDILESVEKYGAMCLKLPKDLKAWPAYLELKQEIDDLKDVLPLITDLKKPSIKDRHWEKIIEITGKKLNYQQEQSENFFLQDLIEANLLKYQEDIVDVTDSADKQIKIEFALIDIKTFWDTAVFDFSTWGKRHDYPNILHGGSVQVLMERLEEDQMTLAALNAQRHVTPFKAQVETSIKLFSEVNETLDLWVKVQQLWTNLEAVFTGGDIAKQMPVEAKKFLAIDKNWLKIMEKSVETKKAIPCCQNDMLKDFLPDLKSNLDFCQKSLEAYLEGKRKKFARFYFVSNPTLLKILSQGSEPTNIQEDFEKLFDAINKVTFDKNPEKKASTEKIIREISSVMGQAEETVVLSNYTKCEGNIEGWLLQLQKDMQASMKDIVRQASGECFNMNLRDFIKAKCAQVALIGIQIIWTQKLTEAFDRSGKNEKSALEVKRKEIQQMMELFTSMCLEDYSSPIERVKVETIVTIHVHQRDLSVELKCKDINDFEWQKQTRIYWKQQEDTCIISITDWDCPYSYEYLGAKERLCITPLTDRCYITLAQALSMYYGGAPAGPAGTGKTETVKDLGRTLGIFVVVTNCSDQHRSIDMAKIFKGLCQSGLWGCFDEFNRIDLEVLSVVAGQVESITLAKKQHVKDFLFPEEVINIDIVHSVGYFITMNPGYAGRQELPENLKVLFRGVTMMVPDRQIIMKVKLASVGYTDIDNLAKKFNILYKLCEEQLSKQRHYDFGLRNILSVLRTAGNTKRQELKSDEEMLLMRSLRDMNLSKFVADDIPLFNSLLADIFPKVTNVPKMIYKEVEAGVRQQVDSKNLQYEAAWILKVIQLYETQNVRHGFMTVGATGVGKSTIMKVLTETLSELIQPFKIIRLNPKGITSQQMYGVKSEISDDWTPGIFSTIWSKNNNRSNKFNVWITCDGPVDAIWIENLNTVLDDNKILTLANGERIPMTSNCKMVFEVENLDNASPATVSRCGIVYISSTDLGYLPVLKSWITDRKIDLKREEESAKLMTICTKWFWTQDIIAVLKKGVKSAPFNISEVINVTQFCNILTGFLIPFVNSNKTLTDQEYEILVIFCMIWSLGGIMEAADRSIIHEILQQKGAPMPPKGKEIDTVFDFYIDKRGGTLQWAPITPETWSPPDNLQFSQVLIPTGDSFKASMISDLLLNQPKTTLCSKAVLLIGLSGTAKTSSVLMYQKNFDPQEMLFKRINFSSATTPFSFQNTVEVECDYKVGKDFAPPGNKNMTLFIDDINMPLVNDWGDQVTLEITRQLVEDGGFYNLAKDLRGQFKNIKNLQFIGAMNHPGGGRNDIPNRLKRHFFTFNMILPLDIVVIYGPIIKHVFVAKKFSEAFNKVSDSLPYATIKLWNKVKDTVLPTPSKFHYVFNMRELSRIFKGILSCKKEVLNSASGIAGVKSELFLIALWRHECERVFVDKLTNNKDKDLVKGYINEISLDAFSQHEADILEKLKKDRKIYFCDFLRNDVYNEEGLLEELAEKVYEGIDSLEALQERCYFLLEKYNEKYPAKKMQLVLFEDAINHLVRVSRIVQSPRSSGLLVGVGGSGKQSLTKLAAEIGRQVIYQMVITKNFQEKDLFEEIKTVFDYTGHQGKHVTFIMTDAEIKKESFLEYINMILSSGEVPGLVPKDEKEVWLGNITSAFIKEKKNNEPTQQQLWEYFVERVRDHMHIMLCFSPVGNKFRERAQKFPALFNECTIDWFLPWPEEALVSVAQSFIEKFDKLNCNEETKKNLRYHMGNVHIMVTDVCDIFMAKMRRQVYVTPKSYLSYLAAYKELYISKFYGELDVQERNFKIGVEKIDEAAESIAKMEVVLKAEDIQLQEAAQKTEILLADLEVESKKAKIKQDEVELTTSNCQKQASQIESEKASAMKDLEAAMPALKRAQNAVDNLDPKDITEMKSNNKPHIIIKYILDSVGLFFHQKMGPQVKMTAYQFSKKDPTEYPFLTESWEECGIAIKNDANLLNKLKYFEKDQINEETIELLQPYMDQNETWFNDAIAGNASKAGAGILAWSLAIFEYYAKSKIVKPKQIMLAEKEGELKVAMKSLGEAQENLKKIQALLAALKEKFTIQIAEKTALEDKANKTKKMINTARTLIGSLTDEQDRWGKGAKEIGLEKKQLIGNCSLATAFISYGGPFDATFRHMLQHEYFVGDMKKRSVPHSSNIDLTNFLVDEATVGEWNIQGLPKDDLSIQNGIMVTNSSRYPLLIDPQGQGQIWIQNKYEEFIDKRWSICNQNHPKFKDNFLKYCMEEGKTLIIEGIEGEVDPMLDPVLEKQLQIKGKNKFIDVGGTQIEFHKTFTMFLTCRLPNPLFSPELSAKTQIINFTVTQGGLEQQLLGRVLSIEQAALEASLNHLILDVNKNKKDLQILDKNLLDRLTSSTGNLLDDTDLMDVLNKTKTQSKEVAIKLADAEIKTKEIQEKREQYRPVAIRGSAIYFCMLDMSLVSWMYNSSLDQFLELFDEAIARSEPAQQPSKRVEIIIKFLTFHVYRYVNRGLFEKDKTSFILMACFKIYVTANKITNNDVSQFLKAGAGIDAKTERARPFNFITDKAWLNILALSRHCFAQDQVPFFRELPDCMQRNEAQWKQWVDRNDPENFPIPDYQERIVGEKDIGSLLAMSLCRSIREDRSQISTSGFINTILGKEFTNPISYPIDGVWAESNKLNPVLFLLTPGSDPTSTIEDFAKKKKKFPTSNVSMGEGQEKKALKVYQEAIVSGGWIILQNCHLGLGFMNDLLTIIPIEAEQERADLIHEDFRLFITCESRDTFPLGLLQRVIKVTNEPPKGIKAGLYKTFTTLINQDFLDKIEHPSWRSLIFTICFEHSIVQERRKFGPLGWCIPYEYNNSDLNASLTFVEKYLNQLLSAAPQAQMASLPINCNVIKYMVSEIQYGGRITDNLDRELFNAYVDDYIKDSIFGNEHTFVEIISEGGTGAAKERYKYKIPANPSNEISKYREYIDTVPAVDNPEVFGLHLNADLTYRLKESLEMIDTLLETRPKDAGSGGGPTREDMVVEKCKEIISKLPGNYNIQDVRDVLKKTQPPRGLTDKGLSIPLVTFLFQEIQRIQNIINIVRKTLINIVDAIDGTIIMTSQLMQAIDFMSDAKVPKQWLFDLTGVEISWMLPLLGSWVSSFFDRYNQLNNWYKNGRPNTFWLTGFFNPQGFLTCVKQEVTRMHKGGPGSKDKEAWSLDDVEYHSTVKEKEFESIKDPQYEGVYVHGLFLEGGRWVKNGLDDSEPKKLFAPLPILYVSAINKKKGGADAERMSTTYSCPVYKYPKRNDKYIIFRVGLPCEGTGPHRWKLRGVCLLCSTE